MKENRIRKNKILCRGIFLLLLSFCLYGCGRQPAIEVKTEEEKTISEEKILQNTSVSELIRPIEEEETKSEKVEHVAEEAEKKSDRVKQKTEEVPESQQVTTQAEVPPVAETPSVIEIPPVEKEPPAVETPPKAESSQKAEVTQKEEMQKTEASSESPAEQESKEEAPSKENVFPENPPEQLDMSQIGDVFVSAEEYDEKVSNSDVGIEE